MDEIVCALRDENAALKYEIDRLKRALDEQKKRYNVYELARFEDFLLLPAEIRVHILSFLDFDTLFACKQSGRVLKSHVEALHGKIPLTVTIRKLRLAALYEVEVLTQKKPILSYEIFDKNSLDDIMKKDLRCGEPCFCGGVYKRGERFGGREIERFKAKGYGIHGHLRSKTRRCYTSDPVGSIAQHLHRFLTNELFAVHLVFGKPDLADYMCLLCFTDEEMQYLTDSLAEMNLAEHNTIHCVEANTHEAVQFMWQIAAKVGALSVRCPPSPRSATLLPVDAPWITAAPRCAYIHVYVNNVNSRLLNSLIKDWITGNRDLRWLILEGQFLIDLPTLLHGVQHKAFDRVDDPEFHMKNSKGRELHGTITLSGKRDGDKVLVNCLRLTDPVLDSGLAGPSAELAAGTGILGGPRQSPVGFISDSAHNMFATGALY